MQLCSDGDGEEITGATTGCSNGRLPVGQKKQDPSMQQDLGSSLSVEMAMNATDLPERPVLRVTPNANQNQTSEIYNTATLGYIEKHSG